MAILPHRAASIRPRRIIRLSTEGVSTSLGRITQDEIITRFVRKILANSPSVEKYDRRDQSNGGGRSTCVPLRDAMINWRERFVKKGLQNSTAIMGAPQAETASRHWAWCCQ